MQRLGDIVKKDLDFIMDSFMDFTKETEIQCGAHTVKVNASLQSDNIQMTSDVSPLNAYSISLYFKESSCDRFNKSLVRNAIIFVDGVSYRIIDSNLTQGLRALSLERKGGR